MPRARQAVPGFLQSCGIEPTPDACDNMNVMVEAMLIYQEREKKHHGLWKEYGWQDTALHVRSKALRVSNCAAQGRPQDGLDEALDAINYAVFFIRNVREGRDGST